MKMYFDADAMVTIRYGTDSWKVRKQYIADYLTGKFDTDKGSDKTSDEPKKVSTLERAVILAQLPLIESIEVSIEKENTITLYPIVTRMEVKNGLYNFLISR